MGRAMGKVRFVKDNKVAWFIYNATMDIAFPVLFDNFKDYHKTAWNGDRGYFSSHTCTCDESEEVEIYESYGGGMLWKGKACRKCMILVENLEPVNFTDSDFPTWCTEDFANE